MALVHEVQPDQCTLVPVLAGEVTSQGGWPRRHAGRVAARHHRRRCSAAGIRVSLFIDPDPAAVRWAAELGADRVELFTEPFARAFEAGPRGGGRAPCAACTRGRRDARTSSGSGSTPGMTSTTETLYCFRELPHLDEVSIGHALVSRALFDGLAATVRAYLGRCCDERRNRWRSAWRASCFGFLTGWIIGAQQVRPASAPAATAAAGAAAGRPAGGRRRRARRPRRRQARSGARSTRCAKRAADNPRDAAVRAEIGNAYFDAERYPEAITWYEASLGLDAEERRTSSTDLGVSYYYANQADRALAQFERSLADRAEAHQDDAEHRRGAGLRQAGSDRRRVDLAAGRRPRARRAPRAAPPSG